VEVCTMRWLGRLKRSGQHASMLIKVVIEDEAEKLLGVKHRVRIQKAWHSGACFKCRRFGHRLRLHATRDVRHVRARISFSV
jgi:hypothetical protein